jgi:hypothetical protein
MVDSQGFTRRKRQKRSKVERSNFLGVLEFKESLQKV